jgi:hypothetical protein
MDLVTCDDVFLCYAFVQYNCDLMYEFAQHMTHVFYIFNASLKHTHANYA